MIKLSPFVGFIPVAAAEIILTRQIHAIKSAKSKFVRVEILFWGGRILFLYLLFSFSDILTAWKKGGAV